MEKWMLVVFFVAEIFSFVNNRERKIHPWFGQMDTVFLLPFLV
jgi:hypothetical protein